MRPLLQVYILTYNRPDTVVEAVESVLRQDFENFQLIVSDNSTNSLTENLLKKFLVHEQFSYMKRTPSMPALEHFNAVLQEVKSDFFMLFHDDDLMKSNCLTKLMTAIQARSNLAAVGSNAFILDIKDKTHFRFMKNLNKITEISSAERMAQHYIDSQMGHVPFPSYIYRTACLKNIKMLYSQGRKHADVTFLIKITERGPVVWLPDCLMYYRKHSGNDSNSIDLKAIISLCRFLENKKLISKSSIDVFKKKHFVLWVRQNSLSVLLKTKGSRVIFKSAIIFLFLNVHLVFKKVIDKFAK